MKTPNSVKIATLSEDCNTWEVDGKILSPEEFEKLVGLMPETLWVRIVPANFKSKTKNKLDFKNAR